MAVEIKDFAVAVADILDGYTEDVREAVADAVEQAGKKALKTVKAKSPKSKGRGGGRYKKGWRMKKERRLGVYHDMARTTIYNATDRDRCYNQRHGVAQFVGDLNTAHIAAVEVEPREIVTLQDTGHRRDVHLASGVIAEGQSVDNILGDAVLDPSGAVAP